MTITAGIDVGSGTVKAVVMSTEECRRCREISGTRCGSRRNACVAHDRRSE